MSHHTLTDFWKIPKELVACGRNELDPNINQFIIDSPCGNNEFNIQYDWRASKFIITVLAESNKTVNVIFDEKANLISGTSEITQGINLPFDLDYTVWNLRKEEYINSNFDQKIWNTIREFYYFIKPLLPRSTQISIRRSLVSPMGKRSFPRWPIDISVEILHYGIFQLILRVLDSPIPMISFWPGEADFCLVLTHDVDTQVGFDNINTLVDIERKHGFRSAWNIVPKRYKIDNSVLDIIQKDGFEIGVHGLYHDGRDFQSLKTFQKRAQLINSYLQDWNSVGFRAASAVRKLEWICKHLELQYDTSCPSSEIFGAQPGGCCTVFPFIFNNVVELPFTLPEDHTLLEILGYTPSQMLEKWLQVVHTIKQFHGMVLIGVHPDYMLTSERLQAYEQFLLIMKQEANCWFALPKEAAQWWRERDSSELIQNTSNGWQIQGPVAGRGKIMNISLGHDGIIDISPTR